MRLHDALAVTLVAKMKTTVDAMVEAGCSLVFTWQKEHARRIADMAAEEDVACVVITGDESHKEREERVAFAAKTGCSVVATIDSLGTGVDGLQYIDGMNTVIFHAIDYVPIKMAQAEGRLHRIGAKKAVTALYIVMEDTVDASTLDVVVEKLSQWHEVMGSDNIAALGTTLYTGTHTVDEAQLLQSIAGAFKEEN
jgi:superfamily II DNA or RNA helicase